MEEEQNYEQQIMGEEMEELDIDNIVFRRADPDDTDAIINLVEIGEDDIYNRVYSYPKVLKLIETAYLAITAIDGDGNVVGFAAFEDYPQVSKQSQIVTKCTVRRECAAWQTTSTTTTGKIGSTKLMRSRSLHHSTHFGLLISLQVEPLPLKVST